MDFIEPGGVRDWSGRSLKDDKEVVYDILRLAEFRV